MTDAVVRNRARKQYLRAHQGGGHYVRAAHVAGAGVTPTLRLLADLVPHFADAGWPIVFETGCDDAGVWHSYAGPVHIAASEHVVSAVVDDVVSEAQAVRNAADTHASVRFTAPAGAGFTDWPICFEPAADWTPGRMVEAVGRLLTEARAQAVSELVLDSQCPVCDQPYPNEHLFPPTIDEELVVCPACVFDGDTVPDALPQRMAFMLDGMTLRDLAAPAGWAAVATLLAYAAAPGLERRLAEARIGWPWEPLEHWTEPGSRWIWLPPEHRPAALSRFGPGASLDAIIAAVNDAFPELLDSARQRISEAWGEDEDGTARHDFPVEELWPAIIAYAVAFGTDEIERNPERPPNIDLTSCFEEGVLGDHFAQVLSKLRPNRDLGVTTTLEIGTRAVAEALGWSTRR